ncbi:SPASM domain-containing protein [uncultured Methanospirillum sp.]
MGNILETPLHEIWYNPIMENYRRNLLHRHRIGLCSKCDFVP